MDSILAGASSARREVPRTPTGIGAAGKGIHDMIGGGGRIAAGGFGVLGTIGEAAGAGAVAGEIIGPVVGADGAATGGTGEVVFSRALGGDRIGASDIGHIGSAGAAGATGAETERRGGSAKLGSRIIPEERGAADAAGASDFGSAFEAGANGARTARRDGVVFSGVATVGGRDALEAGMDSSRIGDGAGTADADTGAARGGWKAVSATVRMVGAARRSNFPLSIGCGTPGGVADAVDGLAGACGSRAGSVTTLLGATDAETTAAVSAAEIVGCACTIAGRNPAAALASVACALAESRAKPSDVSAIT